MSSLNQKIVEQARTWIGTKYHHQGRLKASDGCSGGVDCVGLLVGIINELEIRNNQGELLSKYDYQAYKTQPTREKLLAIIGQHLNDVSIEGMIPGDILLFKLWQEPQHVGILSNYPTGGYGFIHCNSSSGSVIEQPLSPTWQRMISNVCRFKQL